MALITEIADAVAFELSAGGFSQPFTAVRYYAPEFKAEDMSVLHVSVVPHPDRGLTVERVSRSAAQYDLVIDIAVQKKPALSEASAAAQAAALKAELDALMALTQEIAEHFQHHRLRSYPDAAWLKTEYSPTYSLEHLQQLKQFTSVIALTFRVAR